MVWLSNSNVLPAIFCMNSKIPCLLISKVCLKYSFNINVFHKGYAKDEKYEQIVNTNERLPHEKGGMRYEIGL